MTATIALVDPPARMGRSQRRHCDRRYPARPALWRTSGVAQRQKPTARSWIWAAPAA